MPPLTCCAAKIGTNAGSRLQQASIFSWLSILSTECLRTRPCSAACIHLRVHRRAFRQHLDMAHYFAPNAKQATGTKKDRLAGLAAAVRAGEDVGGQSSLSPPKQGNLTSKHIGEPSPISPLP